MTSCVDCVECFTYDDDKFAVKLKPNGGLKFVEPDNFIDVDRDTPVPPLNSLPAEPTNPDKNGLHKTATGLVWADPRAQVQEFEVGFTQQFGGTVTGTTDNTAFIDETLEGHPCYPTLYRIAIARTFGATTTGGRTEFHWVDYLQGAINHSALTGYTYEEDTSWVHTWNGLYTHKILPGTTGNLTMGYQIATASAPLTIDWVRYEIKGVGIAIPECV